MKSFLSSRLKVSWSHSLPVSKSHGLIVFLFLSSVTVIAQTDPYQARRDRLTEKTDKGLIILINNGGQEYVATSGENMNFCYLTGIKTLNAVLVIDRNSGKSFIYRPACRRREPEVAPAGLEAKPMEDLAKDLDLILDYTFKKLGSTGYSIGTQAASGPNSTLVHYVANNRNTLPGEMMVFDIGPEYENYTSDISRSIPVSGKFTKEQKEIYSVVPSAQKAAIIKMQPVKSINEAYETVTGELNKGLFALGLLTDTTQARQKAFWMQHGWSHHIGLVVHDVSGPYVRGKSDLLVPGMIYTMEPGLYFPSDYLEKGFRRVRNVPETGLKAFLEKVEPEFKKYINIGVRIEDDVLITLTDNEVITGAVPKEIPDIEAVMKLKSKFN